MTPPKQDIYEFAQAVRCKAERGRRSALIHTSLLDALLSAGIIDVRQHAAGLAWAAFHRRFDEVPRTSWSGQTAALPTRAWKALKADHAALLAVAGFERFMLDRLCLDGEAPLRCEVERVRKALTRLFS